jgi:hypothetical protein
LKQKEITGQAKTKKSSAVEKAPPAKSSKPGKKAAEDQLEKIGTKEIKELKDRLKTGIKNIIPLG